MQFKSNLNAQQLINFYLSLIDKQQLPIPNYPFLISETSQELTLHAPAKEK